ncbi:Neuroguidin [Nymphaea thermarum]|nr:Neuroguidin [Nymphaea thermarum]
MKEGLDTVRSKVQALMEKVKENSFPTREGISYLDVKYLLLLNYCQSIIYYSLLKAKGLSVSDHPVVRRLVESRLFLEKVRPIDKKLQYQVEKLMRAANQCYKRRSDGKGLYRPPMIAPTSMDEGHSSKHKRTELRKEKEAVRQASHSSFLKEMMNDLEGKPEEVRTSGWHENRDFIREKAKLEERAHMEEENFIRVPYSKEEKKKIKQLKRARNGLLGLVDDFYHEVSGLLPAEAKESKKKKGSADVKGKKNFGKRKRMR